MRETRTIRALRCYAEARNNFRQLRCGYIYDSERKVMVKEARFLVRLGRKLQYTNERVMLPRSLGYWNAPLSLLLDEGTKRPVAIMRSIKGRAIRRRVAEAIGIREIDGVKAVITDEVSKDIMYVVCDGRTWAEIQYRAMKYSGVEHTGSVRRQWLDEHPLLGAEREEE